MQRASLLGLLLFTACSSPSLSDAGLLDGAAMPSDTGVATVDAGIDSGVVPADSGVVPADSGVVPADSGVEPADSGVEPADSGVAPADAGPVPVQCGQPFLIDQEPAGDSLGRLGVYAATGQASALTYTNLSDYSVRVLFHDGTTSSALQLLFTDAEFNGSGSGEAAQGAARSGFAAFIAPRRINDASGVIARRSIAAGTWTGPTPGHSFGTGTNSLAIMENGHVLVGGPLARERRQLHLVTYDLAGSFSSTVTIAPFPVERVSETQLALGPGDHGALVALTTDGVLHGYAIRAGILDPNGVELTPPIPASGLALASLPSGDVYVVWSEGTISANTRATTLHYDPGTSQASFGATEIIGAGSARIHLEGDAAGNLTLLRYSGGHLLMYRRIGGLWAPPADFGTPNVNGPDTLALDAEGTGYVTFLDASDHLLVARAAAGSNSWEPPVMVASLPSSNSHAIGAIGPRGVVITYNSATGVGGGTDVYGILCR